jgi:NADPH:quinone reductase-like Zn-dependent oxidoreductase
MANTARTPRRRLPALTALLLLLSLGAAPLAAAPATGPACPALPETMRAARIHAAGGPDALRIEPVPVPAVRPGEVLVRIAYASVNPVDWKLQQAGRLPFPAIPGGDFAGTVVAVGAGVDGFACGDEVAGIADPRGRGGSYAEYAAVASTDVVPKPAAFTMAQAAGYPTVAVAAWRFLIAAANLQPGERVLVHGGAGGVGSMAVQIAKARGAHVLATASAPNHAYLRTIGVDEPIDYRSVRFEDVARDIDVVIDTVGGETTERSAAVLRDGGRLVTLVGDVPAALCSSGRIACPAEAPWDVGRGLAYVAPLIQAGALRVNIDQVYPLERIAEAQEHNRSGRTRGKVVVAIAPAADAAPR